MVNDNGIYNLDGDNILVGDPEYDTIKNIYKENGDNIMIQMCDGHSNVKAVIWLNNNINIFDKNELIEDDLIT